MESTFKQNETTQSPRQPSSNSPYTFFLVGGAIGAVLGLLFAPKSGVELRTDISDLTRKGYDETLDLAHQIKEQSAEVLSSVKEKTGKVYDLAATKWSHASGQALVNTEKLLDRTSTLSNETTQPHTPANIH